MAFAAFYGFRFMLQCSFTLPYPVGYAWDYPGFPSATIKYGRSNDFFFSGHMGCCAMLIMEYWSCEFYKMTILTCFAMICNFTMLIVLRSHYSVDLFSGFIYGHYVWIMCQRYNILLNPDWYFYYWKKVVDGTNYVIDRSTWKDRSKDILDNSTEYMIKQK